MDLRSSLQMDPDVSLRVGVGDSPGMVLSSCSVEVVWFGLDLCFFIEAKIGWGRHGGCSRLVKFDVVLHWLTQILIFFRSVGLVFQSFG